MIAREAFERYCAAVARVAEAADATVRSEAAAWLAVNPGWDTASAREAAIAIVKGAVGASSDAAGSLAAGLYDELAALAGRELPAAVTSANWTPDAVGQAVRYMAKHLNDGDVDGFLKACGAYAADMARRGANETVIANAGRDRDRGVRFARVPTGTETCAWCFMLAGRGAVYHTRETAGALSRYHHRCDCKVVPGFEDDPDAELVEGWKPAEARGRLALIETQCGAKVGSEWRENDVVTRSMRLRDRDWVFYGKEVEADYSLVGGRIPGSPRKRGIYDAGNYRNTDEPEWRDVFAHDVLAKNGIKASIRPEAPSKLQGVSSPDISINGQLWEIKSPIQLSKDGPEPGNELDYIGGQLKSAKRNFKNPYDPETGEAMMGFDGVRRVVLNLKYRPAPASPERVTDRIVGEMKSRHIKEVLLIDEQGNLSHIMIEK